MCVHVGVCAPQGVLMEFTTPCVLLLNHNWSHTQKKKKFSSSSCWASFQLTPRALLLALGMEHTCTLVRWKQLSGEIAGVTHCSSLHSSFAYFRPAPLIVTGEKVKTLPCPRLNVARCERPCGKLISGNVLAGGARYTCGTSWAETGIGVNKLIKSITAPDKAEGLAWEKPFPPPWWLRLCEGDGQTFPSCIYTNI